MKILVNLSNHPLCKWSDRQTAAAAGYGECRDMPFPVVSPEIDSQGIRELGNKYINELKTLAEDNEVTVHIMGEMSFTHYVVSKLLAVGVPCVCSTSERLVHEEADGKKTVKFQFGRFREYVE